MQYRVRASRAPLIISLGLALSACSDGLDFDLRSIGNGFDTSDAARQATAPRPSADARGVISYPSYQVAIARRGDTVEDVAGRLGLAPAEIASVNGLPLGVPLREGELLALPRRVAEPPAGSPGSIDVAAVAGGALDRVTGSGTPLTDVPSSEPQRHRVAPGETAFQIARLYNVPAQSLAEWNGLDQDMTLRTGQTLLIPVANQPAPATAPSRPGQGTPTPVPPSATAALPTVDARPAAPAPTPPSPQLDEQRTTASDTARFVMPVSGAILRAYAKGRNDGISIAADAGATVRAADAGTVAAITRDTEQVPILVLRHEGNLLTVYAGVDDISVEKGDSVSRGQSIARIRAASPSALHFEVREGFESTDPMPFLN